MKKILVVIPALGPIYGGPSKLAPALAAALARRGLEVDLVTTDANGPNRLEVPLDRWVERDGCRFRYFPRWGRAEYKVSGSLLRWLWRHVRDYDVVLGIASFNFPILALALACRARGVPYIINPQGMLEPWALAYKGWKKGAYYRGIERPLILRGARAIQALNRPEAANIEALRLGRPVFVLPNGIDASEAEPPGAADAAAFLDRFPAARDRTVILFLHRVDPKKGLDLLAPTFAVVRSRFPKTHLVIAGPGTAGFGKTARGYFASVGLGEDAVTFTGMLEGGLKRGALAVATAFVAPTRSEGFSMSVLETMAAGIPGVITTGCNFPEADEAGAARVVPFKDKAFAAALSDLLANVEDARTMGCRARRFVLGNYTWDGVAGRLETMLRDLTTVKGQG